MARKKEGKSFGLGKLEINLTNRWLYTLIAFFVVIVLSVGVYAFGSKPNPGHAWTELAGCDSSGQVAEWYSGSWRCISTPSGSGGGSSYWAAGSTGIYYANQVKAGGAGSSASSAWGLQLASSAGADAIQVTKSSLGSGTTDGVLLVLGIDGGSAAALYNYENGYLALGTNAAERLRIDTSGNVGIGTTTPTAKLHVAGNLVVDGEITSGGGTVSTVPQFVGFTSSTYDGAGVGGYSGGDARCISQVPGSTRMATASDLAYDKPGSGTNAWYSTYGVNDCQQWSSSSGDGSKTGTYYSAIGSPGYTANCNNAFKLACYK